MINDEMKQLLQITKDEEGSLEFSITFPSSFSVFQGHFPGNLILPGVVQILLVQTSLEKKLNLRLRLQEIINAKYKAPVLPGEEIRGNLHFTVQENSCEASCSLQHGEDKKSDLKVRFHFEQKAGN